MKSSIVLFLLYAQYVAAIVSGDDAFLHPAPRRRQLLSGPGGKVPDVPGAKPRRQELPSDNEVPGAKRIKIRSGPYMVPNMMKKTPSGDRGMLWNYPDLNIERPCSGECTILRQLAGLEYANGTQANIDSGMWLHHMVGLVSGPSRWDPTCYGKVSLPHWSVTSLPSRTERYFSSGNERSLFNFNKGNGKTGYHLYEQDVFSWVVDLMNMNMEDRIVYLTMEYDIIPGPLPTGWKDVKTIWLDANQCWTGELPAPQESGAFTVDSEPWVPTIEGRIIDAIGHLHDGGVEVSVLTAEDDKDVLCRQKVKYGESPAFRFTGEMMKDDKPAEYHISSVDACRMNGVREMKKAGQSWKVRGKYDYDVQPGNIESGKQGAIMAISLVLVAVPPGGVNPPGWFEPGSWSGYFNTHWFEGEKAS